MQLSGLAEGAELRAGSAIEVSGVAHDSRDVRPGDLFICLKGGNFDGHRFAADAMERGAAALCVTPEGLPLVPPGAPMLIVPDTRAAIGRLSAAVFDHPSRKMRLVAVTGTNGKTTSTLLTASIFRASSIKTGTIGTLGAELDGESLPSVRTTPEADQLQWLLAEMERRGAGAVTMEASSHALDQGRTSGCEFDAAIFTNLTQDHLDYHGTMESYLEAKLQLFSVYPRSSAKSFAASINLDDPYGERVARAAQGPVVSYAVTRPADVRATDIQMSATRLAFRAATPNGDLQIEIPFGGSFQVYNALGAIGAAIGLGLPNEAIERGLRESHTVPGRFEPVPTGRGFDVIVDYAHTPDGLRNLLESARALHPARVLAVFGCGGDRDPTKRPVMGQIAGDLADVAIVTSDNPRSEEPDAIIAAVTAGMGGARAERFVEPDRRAAIRLALQLARDGDLLLIAGKGHEDYQEVRGVKFPFDDRAVVRELLAETGDEGR